MFTLLSASSFFFFGMPQMKMAAPKPRPNATQRTRGQEHHHGDHQAGQAQEESHLQRPGLRLVQHIHGQVADAHPQGRHTEQADQ